MGTYALDIQKFFEKADKRANAIGRKIIFDIDAALVLKTPVGNADLWQHPEDKPKGYVGGRLRANWQYGVDEAPEGELYEANKGPYPDFTPIQISDEIFGHIHYLVNNLPYAQRVEDGWSTQAPSGMVNLTVIEFKPIVAAAIKALAA